MDWNNRQQVVHKWEPFCLQQMQQVQQQQQQQQLQQQHQLPTQHQQQHPQVPPQQQQMQQQQLHPPTLQINHLGSPKTNRTGGSTTPHCLICNVHLGMFAKGGMEVFSEKVTTTSGKMQIHNVLGSIINIELNADAVHSNIVCKKCFKLLDDIDSLEMQLVGMKQLVSSKYTMTLALVKKGLVGKAVLEEEPKQLQQQQQQQQQQHHEQHQQQQHPPSSLPKLKRLSPKPLTAAGKGIKLRNATRRGRPPKMVRLRKAGKLAVKSGKLVVKDVGECLTPEIKLKEESVSSDDDECYQVELDITADDTEDDSVSHVCSLCNKEFSSRTVLATHLETHGINYNSHKCDICEKSFLTAESLVKHKKLHKGKKKNVKRRTGCQAFDITHIKQFKCRQCSKVFTTKSKAEDHERTHTGEKPFECDICGTCFRQKSNLSSHKRVTHLQERRYKCELCDKAFKWKRLLNGHTMSVHTGERPYKCEFCDAGFVYQQHYKKHMRIHTGEKPFKCEVCGKAFNSSNNCRAHMFTHSDKKPYECTLCGAGFMRKPLVLSHIKQHGQMDNLEVYVKANAPTTALAAAGEGSSGGSRSPVPTTIIRRRKPNRETSNAGVMHVTQGPPQPTHNNVEENIHHFIIQGSDARETTGTGETMGYMFGTFQSQTTVGHYTPLNLGQW